MGNGNGLRVKGNRGIRSIRVRINRVIGGRGNRRVEGEDEGIVNDFEFSTSVGEEIRSVSIGKSKFSPNAIRVDEINSKR
ncbi:MAG: hypothetical protein LBS29_02435, partial [Endomicrobium sp.]|nr:hypothetical protein [Endomicrobium sp.]